MIRDYGDEADLVAAMRADAMLEKGSLDGLRVWKRVLAAVKEIQRQEPREGDGSTVHFLSTPMILAKIKFALYGCSRWSIRAEVSPRCQTHTSISN